MTRHDKEGRKIIEKYGLAEAAEAIMIPMTLTKEEKVLADKELSEYLKKSRSDLKNIDTLKTRIYQLRIKIQDHLEKYVIDDEKTFGSFLKNYIFICQLKQVEFAKDISIQPAELSQYVNGHRTPPLTVIIRFEIHSEGLIPATLWYQLSEKVKLIAIAKDKKSRREQKKFVKSYSKN